MHTNMPRGACLCTKVVLEVVTKQGFYPNHILEDLTIYSLRKLYDLTISISNCLIIASLAK